MIRKITKNQKRKKRQEETTRPSSSNQPRSSVFLADNPCKENDQNEADGKEKKAQGEARSKECGVSLDKQNYRETTKRQQKRNALHVNRCPNCHSGTRTGQKGSQSHPCPFNDCQARKKPQNTN